MGHERGQIDVGNNVAVDDPEGLLVPELGQVSNSPGRTQDVRFPTGCDRQGIGAGGDVVVDALGQMVCIDSDMGTPRTMQGRHEMVQKGASADGEERFGDL